MKTENKWLAHPLLEGRSSGPTRKLIELMQEIQAGLDASRCEDSDYGFVLASGKIYPSVLAGPTGHAPKLNLRYSDAAGKALLAARDEYGATFKVTVKEGKAKLEAADTETIRRLIAAGFERDGSAR